jgi:hypothetical protein
MRSSMLPPKVTVRLLPKPDQHSSMSSPVLWTAYAYDTLPHGPGDRTVQGYLQFRHSRCKVLSIRKVCSCFENSMSTAHMKGVSVHIHLAMKACNFYLGHDTGPDPFSLRQHVCFEYMDDYSSMVLLHGQRDTTCPTCCPVAENLSKTHLPVKIYIYTVVLLGK